MGPTASGKSALAERLAETFEGELISVDSALVYRGLSIGAAKPDYPHHLVHMRHPDDPYTAADFATDAKQCIDEIRGRGRRPILVGGSMLYFRALIQGLDDIPAIDRPYALTSRLRHGDLAGLPCISNSVRSTPKPPVGCTPITVSGSAAHWRCIAVPAQPLSEWQQGNPAPASDDYECIALCPEDRAVLHARIASPTGCHV
jgi:tRNA dimethylallyltransferase